MYNISDLLREVVVHKEKGHNFMTNGRFVIPLIGSHERKTLKLETGGSSHYKLV
jgi:hypothetical protein